MKKWILILAVLLTGCEEQIEWELQSQELYAPVVDGMITNERKAHRVILTLPVTGLNQAPAPVSGALVVITDGDTIYRLREYPPGTGYYYTDSTVQGVIDKVYYLYIKIGEHEFTSDAAQMKPVGPMEDFQAAQRQDDPALYEMIYKESGDPSMMQVYMDWSYLVPPEQKEEAHAWMRYYTLKSIDVNELFKPAAEQVLFPAGTVIYRRKLSLSTSYQSFLRSLMMETEWKGGIFDVLPANVRTNMHDGALGFFAACSVVTDTLVFYPGK